MGPFLLPSWLKNPKLRTWTPFEPHVFRFIKISFNQLIAFIICEPLLAQKHLLISTAGAVYYNLKRSMDSKYYWNSRKKAQGSIFLILQQCFPGVGEGNRIFAPFLATGTCQIPLLERVAFLVDERSQSVRVHPLLPYFLTGKYRHLMP